MGLTQLLAPCWSQRSHSPAVRAGTVGENKLQPSLKHLCCQEEKGAAGQALRAPLPCHPAPGRADPLHGSASLQPGWPLQCRGHWVSRLGLTSAQASLDPGCCPQRKTPSGLSQLCQEGHWQWVSTEILCATAAGGKEGCSAWCTSLSCLPVGLLSCVL